MTDYTETSVDLAKLAWLSILLPGNVAVRAQAGVELATGTDLATLLANYEAIAGVPADLPLLLSVAESAVLNAGMHGDQEQAEAIAHQTIADAKRA